MKSANLDLVPPLFVFCALLVLVQCGQDRFCDPLQTHHPHQMGVCGTSLADMLSIACMYSGGFYSMDFKRSGKTDDHQKTGKHAATSMEQLRDIVLSRRSAFQFLVNKKSVREDGLGVVCECCYHNCKLSEMRQYCAYDVSYYDMFQKRGLPDGSAEDTVSIDE